MLVHIAVPALGMVATHWAVVCWSKSQILRETFYDLKYIYRRALHDTAFFPPSILDQLPEKYHVSPQSSHSWSDSLFDVSVNPLVYYL